MLSVQPVGLALGQADLVTWMAVPVPASASCQTSSMSETWQEIVIRSFAWSTRSFCGIGKSG